MGKNIIVADSNILSEMSNYPIYGILSLSGQGGIVNRMVTMFSEFFQDQVLDVDSFENWFNADDNGSRLLNFLMSIQNDESKCSFNAYLSDHDYLKFVVYLNTLCEWDKIKQICSNVDSEIIYQSFDSSLLSKINVCPTSSVVEEFNGRFEDLLSKQMPKEKFLQYLNLKLSLEAQTASLENLNKHVIPNLSVLDYLQYMELLDKHSVSSIDICIYASHHVTRTIASLYNLDDSLGHLKSEKWNFIELESNPKVASVMKNLVVISNYTWNVLHKNISLEEIPKQDRMLILLVWLIFQSHFSKWMITSSDFLKIKNCYESLLNDK